MSGGFCDRYNKLGLNAVNGNKVSEVHEFTRVQTEPLSRLKIVSAAVGHTHSAVVTGKLSSVFFIIIILEDLIMYFYTFHLNKLHYSSRLSVRLCVYLFVSFWLFNSKTKRHGKTKKMCERFQGQE